MSTDAEKIQEILISLEKVYGEYEKVKFQQAIFESRFESEQGTAQREHKRLQEEIDKANKHFFDFVFDREKGLAFIVDRLVEQQKKRERINLLIWSTAIGLVGKIIWDFIPHK